MVWPLSQDYNEAIQSPASNFADADLKRGQAVTSALGLPVPCSGNFADVYQVRCPDGSHWAVKCFTREAAGLRDRYQEISRHLQQAKLPFTVDFTYLEQGIRVAGRWYPVLKMQWVEGLTLNEFVGQYLDKPATMQAILQVWQRMAGRLREAKVTHCDLQHGNVLLVPGSKGASLAVKLIDYDGMWVPALAGQKSGEVGHPAYQHPQRLREGTYSFEVDRFPHLVIYTALRAVIAGGRPLWDRFNNGDNLLFRQADLEAPNKSALFAELLKLEDRATRSLVEKLIDAARKPLEQSPLLEDVLPGTRGIEVSGESALSPPTATAPAPVTPPTAPVVRQAVFTPPAAEAAFASFQPNSERPRRRQGKPAVWLAVAGALAVLVVVIVLIASRPSELPKGPQVVGKDTNTDRARAKDADNRKDTDKPKDTEPDRQKDKKDKKDKTHTPEKPAPLPRLAAWKSLAGMPTARSLLAAVTGPDGRIYAIGGENASGRLDTVEFYDPSSNKWTTAPSMPTARNHLAATLGPDNLIYAIGGVGGANIVEAYNPNTNKWTAVAPMPTARHGLAAVTGPDGRIYAIGGGGPSGSLNTVEAYDPTNNTWATVANMPTARVYLAAATGPDGRIYAIGGFQDDGKRLDTVEAYDTKKNTWTTAASMTTARNAHSAATGPDGRIYAIGGHTVGGMPNIVEAYDPSANKWTPAANMPTVRGQLAATTGSDGRIYAIGGGDGSFLNTVEALCFTTNKP